MFISFIHICTYSFIHSATAKRRRRDAIASSRQCRVGVGWAIAQAQTHQELRQEARPGHRPVLGAGGRCAPSYSSLERTVAFFQSVLRTCGGWEGMGVAKIDKYHSFGTMTRYPMLVCRTFPKGLHPPGTCEYHIKLGRARRSALLPK